VVNLSTDNSTSVNCDISLLSTDNSTIFSYIVLYFFFQYSAESACQFFEVLSSFLQYGHSKPKQLQTGWGHTLYNVTAHTSHICLSLCREHLHKSTAILSFSAQIEHSIDIVYESTAGFIVSDGMFDFALAAMVFSINVSRYFN